MKSQLIVFFMVLSSIVSAQPNCEVHKENPQCYNACKTAMKAIRYAQGSHQSQVLFDEAIELCPSFAYAYMEKGVPYLKRGAFIQWKKLIDKAVDLEPLAYLGYRGWCRLQFLRDYKGAIRDIEKLKLLSGQDIGHCQNGKYHLEVARGLCYKELGQLEKARDIIKDHLSAAKYPDLYDYYHLGVIAYDLKDYKAALGYLRKQLDIYELAEVHYYLAKTYRILGQQDKHIGHISKSEQLYNDGRSMYDNYAEPIDKIYMSDILKEKGK